MRKAAEKRNPAPLAGGNRADFEESGQTSINHNTVDLNRSISPATKWKMAHPKEVWAQAALRLALKRGLVIQMPCEVCGAPDADGHHDDYDKPMQVRWLCRLHHRREHLRLKCEAAP